jgi:hypothetical protein
MMLSIRRVIVFGLIALALAPVAELRAQQGRALPSFALVAADEQPASSDVLVREGAWVLIVAQMPCRACNAVFGALDQSLSPEQITRLGVIVSAASPAQASGMRARFANLGAAGWYRDDATAALGALGATGAPVVAGLQGNRVMWTRNVSAMSAADVQSLVVSWIR